MTAALERIEAKLDLLLARSAPESETDGSREERHRTATLKMILNHQAEGSRQSWLTGAWRRLRQRCPFPSNSAPTCGASR